MKKIFGIGIALVIVLAGLYCLIVGPTGRGEYSVGYRYGVINKYSEKGLISFTKSGEGRMMMGVNSTEVVEKNKEGKVTKTINPFEFSTIAGSEVSKKIAQYAERPVVVKYIQKRIEGYAFETDYEVVDVYPVDTTKVEPVSFGEKDGTSRGFLTGRIVKVSRKGTFVKSAEILFQEGNAGGQFKALSASSDQEREVCERFLKAGQFCKLSYNATYVRNLIAEDTPYNLEGITPEVAPKQ